MSAHRWCEFTMFCERCGMALKDTVEHPELQCFEGDGVVSLRARQARRFFDAVADQVLVRLPLR